jgi:hypothetical protein
MTISVIVNVELLRLFWLQRLSGELFLFSSIYSEKDYNYMRK